MTDPLSATFAALADPTRRAILARLSLGETSVSELAEPFDISLPAVSRHLKVLEHAGLIARGREAQWRPCRIEPQALKSVDEWLEEYRRLWEQRLDRLEDYLRTLTEPRSRRPTSGEPKSGEKKHEKSVVEKIASTSIRIRRTIVGSRLIAAPREPGVVGVDRPKHLGAMVGT